MNLELGVIGAGFLGMVAWNWRLYARLDAKLNAMRGDMATVKERLAGVEATLALLVKGLEPSIRLARGRQDSPPGRQNRTDCALDFPPIEGESGAFPESGGAFGNASDAKTHKSSNGTDLHARRS